VGEEQYVYTSRSIALRLSAWRRPEPFLALLLPREKEHLQHSMVG